VYCVCRFNRNGRISCIGVGVPFFRSKSCYYIYAVELSFPWVLDCLSLHALNKSWDLGVSSSGTWECQVVTCPHTWTEALRCLEVELDSGVGSVLRERREHETERCGENSIWLHAARPLRQQRADGGHTSIPSVIRLRRRSRTWW
jgi:hypothetical protein